MQLCAWGDSLKQRDTACLDQWVRKAGFVVDAELDSLTSAAKAQTLIWLLSIIDNLNHPLHSTISRQRSGFSDRLLLLSCSTDRQRKALCHLNLQHRMVCHTVFHCTGTVVFGLCETVYNLVFIFSLSLYSSI